MPISVGVIFELRQARTRPGEVIHVVGARRELGKWQPLPQDDEQARSLRTSPISYPCWYMHSPIWFELETESNLAAGADVALEYKFVRDRRGLDDGDETVKQDRRGLDDGRKLVKWEVGIPNRCVSLPAEDNSIWIVSHSSWNSARDLPQVTRVTEEEISFRVEALGGMDRPRAGVSLLSSPRIPTRLLPKVSPLTKLASLTTMPSTGSQHFQLTPRQDDESPLDSSGNSSPWPIEAEFSTNFSTPPVSPDVRWKDGLMMDTDSTDSDSGSEYDNESCKDSGGLFEAQTTEDRHERFGPHPHADDYFLSSEEEQENENARLREEIESLRDAAEMAATKADMDIAHLNAELERLRGVAGESAAKDVEIQDLRLENERLHSIVAEACEEVEELMMQNAALRDSLEKARKGDTFEEVSTPLTKKSQYWQQTKSLRWKPLKEEADTAPIATTTRVKAALQEIMEDSAQKELTEPQEEP